MKHSFNPSKCLGCENYALVCPNKAIEMIEVKQRDGTVKKQPKININKCCFCRLCENVCPTEAIQLTKEIPMAREFPFQLKKEII